jgi:hypothetical protein
MPRKDGFGPYGQGPMTGRRMGYCVNNARLENFYGYRRNQNIPLTKEELQLEKDMLEKRIAILEKKLQDM